MSASLDDMDGLGSGASGDEGDEDVATVISKDGDEVEGVPVPLSPELRCFACSISSKDHDQVAKRKGDPLKLVLWGKQTNRTIKRPGGHTVKVVRRRGERCEA